jgi:hypothetical protein
MGGDGVLGPVSDWRTQYYAGDSITVATEGQVSLFATQWNYTSSGWVKHVVESSGARDQGFMPADINGDGIRDLVAPYPDSGVWYENSGDYAFTKHLIGPNDNITYTYPCDLDEDGDMDILTGGNGKAGWYENNALVWTWHEIDSTGTRNRVSPADVDIDGDIDIIGGGASIYLFRNDGSENFTSELVTSLPSTEGWRVRPADFNGDGYPDIYSVCYNTYIFLNDGTGHFTQSFHVDYWPTSDFDGAWPSDIDMDGDMDLVCATFFGCPWGRFYAFLNDGTGNSFDTLFLTGDGSRNYCDGAIARDIDLDGYPDIAGTFQKVGWFRQDPLNPLTFALYNIDDINDAHWIYADKVCEKCIPSIDLLVGNNDGSLIVYENKMLEGFATTGTLESSVLELATTDICSLRYFEYEACVPNDTSLCFYWRAGLNLADIVAKPWDGPRYATTIGIPCITDSFVVGIDEAYMFQYKAEFRNGDDIAVLYRVWLTYDCGSTGIDEESGRFGREQEVNITFSNDGKLLLDIPCQGNISLEIYDITGRLVKSIFDGYLSSGAHQFDAPKNTGIFFAVLRTQESKRTLKIVKF